MNLEQSYDKLSLSKVLKDIHVGTLNDAKAACSRRHTPDERKAFMEGFRFARNRLQEKKSILFELLNEKI